MNPCLDTATLLVTLKYMLLIAVWARDSGPFDMLYTRNYTRQTETSFDSHRA